MSVRDEILRKSDEIERLRERLGVLSLHAYVMESGEGSGTPLFVADLDVSKRQGYSDRYFDMFFGLQRIFARTVDLVESQMFEQEQGRSTLIPVPLEALRATA
jgi:hypothetical protein